MKKRNFLFLFLLFGVSAQAQYGNEWINYNQSYFRVPVLQKGLYRLTTDDLKRAGFPLTTTDATTLQLFFRGQEQAIFVAGETDKRLDNEDFIEFYGEGNDGTQDSLLYIPNSAQPHKIYNLYSDTTAYFLTWRLDGKAGKRVGFYQETSQNLAPEAYHLENLLISNIKSSNYEGMSEGLIYPVGSSAGTQMSYYDYGEGWSGPEWNKNKNYAREITLENVFFNGPAPRLEVHLMGRDHRKHRVEVMAGTSTRQRTLETATFEQFYPYLSKQEILFSDISNNKLFVSTTSRGETPEQPDDTYSVTYYRLIYPQKFDFQTITQKYFYLKPNPNNRSALEIQNATAEARLYDVTDKNNVIRIGASLENSTLKAVVRNSNTSRTLFLSRAPLPVLGVERVGFRNIDPAKANYLLITHRNLVKSAKTYADYRASAAGGRYDTLTVNMDLLVNQFNYGEFSPLAVKRFVAFMVERGNPKFLFIVGRTTQVDFTRNARDRYLRDMVPTFGWPGSDLMFSQGLKGYPAFVPALPTGRLWTDSQQTVLDYLEKVKEHEATPMNALWRKNILHLSGGISPFEIRQFKGYVDEFKQKAQRQFLGARVTTITKKTDEATEYVGITNQINEGAGLITLFGHSSLSVTDIDIGFVSNDVLGYRNKGRYPLMYANGCVLGNFTFGANTYPVDWVGTRDRGAILFLAHANLAYSFSLKQYGDSFYETLLNDSTNVGRPFGEVQRDIVQKLLKRDNSPIQVADAQQMSLQGDPAVVIFPSKQTDYSLHSRDILITGKNGFAAFNDSLEVKIVVSNFGLFFSSNKLKIKLLRTSKDGVINSYSTIFPAIAYQDSLLFRIPNNRNQSGLNRFEVLLDPDNAVLEMNENNNNAALDFNLPVLGAYPLLPAEYAIVSASDLPAPVATLVAQTVENTTRNYAFELDTTARFDSPLKTTQNISTNALPTWQAALLTRDSTTYYWRVRYADRPANDENRWAESSFTYLKTKTEGWTQRQPAQFTKATPLQINLSTTSLPVWTYQRLNVPVRAVLNGASVGGFNQGFSQNQLSVGDILLVNSGNCATYDPNNGYRPENNLIAVAIRRETGRAYSVLPALNCGNPPYVANTLRDADIINNQVLERFLNAVPTGDYVVLMTSGNLSFDLWPTATKAKLQEIGVSSARLAEIRSGRPYLFIGQKGATQLIAELLTDPNDIAPSLRTLKLENFNLKTTFGSGQISSSLVGPAQKWSSLNYLTSRTGSLNPSHSLFVAGVDLAGKETVLLSNQTAQNIDLQAIDAKRYPFLRLQLRLNNNDVNAPNPAQLQSWLVAYTPVAEGVATSDLAAPIEKQEGETLAVNLSFKNVSNVPFSDSILVRTVLNLSNGQTQNRERRYKPLKANELISIKEEMKTLGNAGENRLLVQFNPRQQPEQTYANNSINLPFTVLPDRLPPTIDVIFDGLKIKNNEVVSANPTIVAQFRDENKFLFKRDTLGLDLFLQRPNEGFKRISFGNKSGLTFQPANAQNVYQIEYRPGTLPDGTYNLRVQGNDASNNRTGIYTISFQVLNEQKLLSFNVYPNPFRDLLRFSFAISGSSAPDEAQIIINDSNGKLIKVLALPLRVGLNEWTWHEANALPVGTYLYRFIVRKNGQDVPLSTGIATSGKVVLSK